MVSVLASFRMGIFSLCKFCLKLKNSFAPGPPGIPADITMEESTMDTLTISWSNSQNMGVVLGYQVISTFLPYKTW